MIRNPYDPIALSVLRGNRTLDDAIAHYVERCEAVLRARALFAPGEVLPVRYEDLVADPRALLRAAAAHLGVEPDPAWLDACGAIVHARPERSRDLIAWPASAIEEVRARTAAVDFLAGYAFEQEVRA